MLSSVAWALGCSLGALAGILLAPETADMSTTVLTLLVITAFAAAVVGRLRSLPLTYLGALILATLDFRVRTPLNLTDGQIADLVAFLKSLTDPAARDLSALVPARVPSGLPVQE